MNTIQSKKGNMLNNAPQLIMTLVIIGIVGAIGLSVVVGVGDGFTAGTAPAQAINNITAAIQNFFSLAPVLGTVFIAVILLAAVGALAYFGFMRNR